MAITKFIDTSLPLIALLITACTGNNQAGSLQDTNMPVALNANDIVLPIDVGRYNTWYCQDNTIIETQFIDDTKTTLQVKYQGKQHILLHRASRLPAIYENNELAFYSDGESAVIGKPLSDKILHGGCHL